MSWTAQTTRLAPNDGSSVAATETPVYHVHVEHHELRPGSHPPGDPLAVGALAAALSVGGAASELDLEQIEDARLALASSGQAIRYAPSALRELSDEEGARILEGLGKLILRAYDAEADVIIRGLRPHTREAALARLDALHASISELGTGLELAISDEYHALRARELQLTADYLVQLSAQRERDRLASARLEEEEKEYRTLEAERRHLESERAHYTAIAANLRAKEDDALAAEAEQHVAMVNRTLEDVAARVARLRAGSVYVVSNVGAFGEHVVKIGLTRRQDPHGCVSELGGDAVPFRFDVHAIVFSTDAVSLVSALHRELAERRVNLVNERCDFFLATPQEARQALLRLHGDPLSFVDQPEAAEWRQSELERRRRRASIHPPMSSAGRAWQMPGPSGEHT